MLKKIKEWISDYRLEKELKKEIDSSAPSFDPMANTTEQHEDAVQASIIEGVRRIKSKVSTGALTEGYDLLGLAQNDHRSRTAEILKDIHVAPEVGQDQMIDKRINHYTELQQAKVKREKAREERRKDK